MTRRMKHEDAGRRRIIHGEKGSAAAECVLLACLLGGACILVGGQLASGARLAALHLIQEISGASPAHPPASIVP